VVTWHGNIHERGYFIIKNLKGMSLEFFNRLILSCLYSYGSLQYLFNRREDLENVYDMSALLDVGH
jgi:hypothetical protein